MSQGKKPQGRQPSPPSPSGPPGDPSPEPDGVFTDPVSLRQIAEIFNTSLIGRQNFVRSLMDPRRDLYAECGYPADPVDVAVYQELYDREAVAKRVVEVMPRETWQVCPAIYEDEDGNVTTAFEEALARVDRELAGPDNFYAGNEGGRLRGVMREADIVCGIGHYGVVVLGLDDGKDMLDPAVYREDQRVLWALALPESMARIEQLDADVTSPRFGQPLSYAVTFRDPNVQGINTVMGPNAVSSQSVHWTRVVHVSENGTLGVPRMRPVLNRLLDVRKLYGGSAEMYWRGAFPGISFETDPSLGGFVTYDKDAVRSQVEAYMNGLQRYFALNGFTAKSLAPQVVDPSPQIAVQIEAVCIEIGCPVRIFKGSERGELASSQDDAAWNDRLKERQNNFTTPRVIVPLINRLIRLGVLPEPKGGYHVWWPDLTSQTNEQKSTVALKLMQSLAQYVSSGGDAVIAPYDFLVTVWGLEEDEALAVIERAREHVEEYGLGSLQTPDAPNAASQMPQDSPDPSKPATPPPLPGKEPTEVNGNGAYPGGRGR